MVNPQKKAVSCMKCNAAFHRDCWLFNGQCGIYGCGCKTYVGFRERQTDEIVQITEETRAPVTVRPYIEALVRTLPRWGRRVIPAASLGVGGSLVVTALYFTFTGMSFSGLLTSIFIGTGLLYSLFSVPLGGTIRRHPDKVGYATFLLSTVLYGLSRTLNGTPRAIIVASAVLMGMLLSNAVAERLTGPYRLQRFPGPGVLSAIRAVLTGLVLFVFLLGLTVFFGPHPVSIFLSEIACVSVLGLFVAAPPLELSKSAFIKHLQSTDDETS